VAEDLMPHASFWVWEGIVYLTYGRKPVNRDILDRNKPIPNYQRPIF
jgi:hypothetical protein